MPLSLIFEDIDSKEVIIIISCMRIAARIFLHELHGERITMRLNAWSFLSIDLRGPPFILLSRKMQPVLNLTMVLCVAVLDYHNLAPVSLPVCPSPGYYLYP